MCVQSSEITNHRLCHCTHHYHNGWMPLVLNHNKSNSLYAKYHLYGNAVKGMTRPPDQVQSAQYMSRSNWKPPLSYLHPIEVHYMSVNVKTY